MGKITALLTHLPDLWSPGLARGQNAQFQPHTALIPTFDSRPPIPYLGIIIPRKLLEIKKFIHFPTGF
jgi:hypothetical protein